MLREFLTRRIAGGRMPGAAWWVGRADAPRTPWSRGVAGHATLEPQAEPVVDTTPFDLASLTKPLATAVLLVLAEQERRLDLDAALADSLPEAAGTPYATTTLAALACHTSGLPAWAPLYLEAQTRADYVAAILDRAPVAPGQALYSDLGYMLLGVVLERVEGRGLDESFRQRIAAPLGLQRTGFATGTSDYGDAAATERGNDFERKLASLAGSGHAWRTELLRGQVHDANAWQLGGVAGHAGLFGPIDEVATLGRELLRPRRITLDPAARRRLLEPGPQGRSVGFVAAGAAAAARGILPGSAPGHTGFTGTSLWLVPDTSELLVLLTNRVHPVVPRYPFGVVRRGFHRLARRRHR